MKRICAVMLMPLLLLLNIFPIQAMAETVLFDDQGGVRVFLENGRTGLMDGGGNILLPAEYDEIAPFAGSEFAMVSLVHGNEMTYGVVDREGKVRVPCENYAIEIHPEARTAEVWTANDEYEYVLYDLDSAQPWLMGENEAYDAVGDMTLVLEYGSADFGYNPPFHTSVYNLRRELVQEADVWIVREYENGWLFLEDNDGQYSIVDTTGHTIVENKAYIDYVDTEQNLLYWSDHDVPNNLNESLKSCKLDRDHLRWYLKHYLGIDGTVAQALLWPLKDQWRCGVSGSEGTSIEVSGLRISGPDAADLYQVFIPVVEWKIEKGKLQWNDEDYSRAGYMNVEGRWVIPPQYDDTYAFVDGAAVVKKDGAYHLIDTEGRQVGDIVWTWPCYSWDDAVFEKPLVPVFTDDGFRFIDRKGQFVSEQTFTSAGRLTANGLFILTEGGRALYDPADNLIYDTEDGTLCLMDNAGHVYRPEGEPLTDWNWNSGDPDTLWMGNGQTSGCIDLREGHIGEWKLPPIYTESEWETGNIYRLDGPDGRVYGDTEGHVFGPWVHVSSDDAW